MTREWFSAAELAGLTGMPGTERGIAKMGQRGELQRRPRAKGKGWEYHIGGLPAEARAHLGAQLLAGVKREAAHAIAGAATGRRQAFVATLKEKTTQATSESGLAQYASLDTKAKTRADARAAILEAVAEYSRLSHLSDGKALHQFCAAYNAGKIQINDTIHSLVPDVHPSTVYRWRKQLKEGGLARLAGAYHTRKGSSKIDRQDDLRDFVLAMLTEYPHASAVHVRNACLARFRDTDISLPSQRGFDRWINAWKEQNKQLFLAVSNPDGWKNRYMSAFGSASADVLSLNQRWELDSTPADVMLLDGRHCVIGVIDVYSRRPRLLVSPTSKATAIALLLRRTLLDWGVPQQAKTDNGSDYAGRHISRVFTGLDIEHLRCNPFSGWEKPHIERFFRTFSHDLVELLPGYIGHNVTDRQAIEARRSFGERLFKKDQAVELRMTGAEFQAFCDQWVDDLHMHRPQKDLGDRTPLQVAAASTIPLRRIENERALDVLLAEAPDTGIRTVTKKGIKADNITYIAPELALHIGEQVRVAYGESVSQVYVFGDEGFICVAEAPEYAGISRREIAAKGRELQKGRMQDARRALRASARRLGVKDIAREILDDAARGANVTAFPRHGIEHTSEGLTAAAQAAAATEAPESRALDRREQQLLDEINTTPAPAAPVHAIDDQQQRFLTWQRLDERLRDGQRLEARDYEWWQRYGTSDECRFWKEFNTEFGMGEDVTAP